MKMPDAFDRFWSARLPRERRMLSTGAALLSLLIIWLLLIEPAAEGRSRWQKALPELRRQLAQMRAISSELAALPAPLEPASDWSSVSVERSLKDKGLSAQSLVVSDSGMTANFANVSFVSLVEWLQQTQSAAHLIVTEASMTARELPGRVDARLALHRPQ